MFLKKVKAWKAICPAGSFVIFTDKVKAYQYATMGGLVFETFVHREDK